ncbi:DNA-binding transcriptional regulator, LysR family [Pseudomonas gessardii]|uniref:LysR family transcriptional regulator n=1 Tax=Pseudomonas gessardii TaxID=78544 RepID=A0A7Y1MRJ8_9PSED|nr:LysR family transcriptional regulator [Pseudomonas gessardii]MRU52337.1 LysR family transcriptional regulator [Pseudomonas gessardii]NNA97085.1 LysR family transcriptional regulator [Pseudomonas gessardii]ONH39916.1 LysR family transcriptional regulator [Pseudomonas gessardii]SDQ39507.1 DNA-binding transcriptional regulator, LysR family [Pseudomonas gessardii]
MTVQAPLIDRELALRFLTCARCASFRQAARSLNIRTAELRKQLALLEGRLGSPLFIYRENALRLTLKGQRLKTLLMARFGDVQPPVGTSPQPLLRLAVEDSLMRDLLAREVLDFMRKHPAIQLEVIPLTGEPTRQADVMVWLADADRPRPSPGFAMTTPQRLARIDYSPHMAKRYCRGNRLPTRIADLSDFMLVQGRTNAPVAAFEPWNRLVKQRQRALVQVHSQEWVREWIKHSACVGLLPNYITRLDKNLLALTPLFSEPMERLAWLSIAPLTADQPYVQTLVALIRKVFEERRDWFESVI